LSISLQDLNCKYEIKIPNVDMPAIRSLLLNIIIVISQSRSRHEAVHNRYDPLVRN